MRWRQMRQAFDCRSEVGHGAFQSRELGLVEKLTGIADGINFLLWSDPEIWNDGDDSAWNDRGIGLFPL
eukprot:scaffold8990_cov87-Cylindrotheca_fusiformis.AAC.3